MLGLKLLGITGAFRGKSSQSLPLNRQGLVFLGYLAVGRGRCVPRDKMAEDLWPDAGGCDSQHQLSAALFRVRQAIEPAGRDLISSGPSGELCLDRKRVTVDAEQFRDKMTAALQGDDKGRADADSLRDAIDSYDGRFMDGIEAGWVRLEREELSRLYVRGLIELMNLHKAQDRTDDALECGMRALKEDPFKEAVVRDVMQIHVESGEPAEARRVFTTFSVRLAEEMEIAPSSETIELNRRLAGGVQ
jgi:DNA-binding SARP family transcriptional activator